MELDNVLKLAYWLSDCPVCWKNFRAWHDSHSTNWEKTLNTAYNAHTISNDPENVSVVFPNKEEKVRFILTWG